MSALRERWAAFSPRERTLLMVAGGLAALFLLSILVLRPMAQARADGLAAYQSAVQTRAAVARAVRSGGRGGAATGDLRGVASSTADARGIVIDRYDFQDGAVDLTIAAVAAPTLYAWLATLETDHGVVVREAAIRTGGEAGQVTARLTLEQRR